MKRLISLILFASTCFAYAQPKAATLSRPAITGISHLTLYADDLAQSRAFYSQTMGWDAVPAHANVSGMRFYANHAQYVALLTPPRAGMTHRLEGLGFLTTDAEALRRYLGVHGVAVPAAVMQEENGDRSFVVHDPEGNKVSFVQTGEHAPARPADASRSLSNHIMHAGYEVHDRAAIDHFYKDVLGFHLYWQGGNPSTRVDWVMMQVPNGTDWIEYMLYLGATPTRAALGSANHLAPGVVSVAALQQQLEARGWKPEPGTNPQVLGVDGKMQLDLTDPDGTRVEFMEFKPVKEACCSAYTGMQPEPTTAW